MESAGHECRGMSSDILTCHLLLRPADLGGLRGGGRGFTHCRRCCCCLGHFHLRFGERVWRFLLTQLKLAAELLVLTVEVESQNELKLSLFFIYWHGATMPSFHLCSLPLKFALFGWNSRHKHFSSLFASFSKKLHSLPVRTFIYFFYFTAGYKKCLSGFCAAGIYSSHVFWPQAFQKHAHWAV